MPIVLFFTIYLFMLKDTNNLIDDFEKCVSCYDVSESVRNSALYEYYYDNFQGEVKYAKIKIYRKFVIHNFNKGLIWVKYSFEQYDTNNNKLRGSWDISSKWYIEKQNGQWVVTDIDERP